MQWEHDARLAVASQLGCRVSAAVRKQVGKGSDSAATETSRKRCLVDILEAASEPTTVYLVLLKSFQFRTTRSVLYCWFGCINSRDEACMDRNGDNTPAMSAAALRPAVQRQQLRFVSE
eukprot:1236434-Pleurochrysis_carterae.AAC.4